MNLEYCFNCDQPTGRAGRFDDSIYCAHIWAGNWCEDCWEEHSQKVEHGIAPANDRPMTATEQEISDELGEILG